MDALLDWFGGEIDQGIVGSVWAWMIGFLIFFLVMAAISFAVRAIMRRKIDVTADNWQERNRQKRVQSVFSRFIDLALLQILLIGIAAAAFLIADLSDGRLLAEADTALDLLNGYLLWMQLVLWTCIGATVLVVLGNILIFVSLRRGDGIEKKHVTLAVIGVLLSTLFLVGANWGAPSTIRDIREDIAAIEMDKLTVADYTLHLHWTGYYRTSSLRDMGEYRPLYVVRREPIGRIYFPRPLSPTDLKAMAASNVYQHPGRSADFRLFEIRFTPNTHIVVEAHPVRGD
ncbi:MAG: hypothetical protein FWE12_07055 [Oscillospiraceae bacterium]|nr:hypothetical protein [Oscillospiraceae bacterium]